MWKAEFERDGHFLTEYFSGFGMATISHVITNYRGLSIKRKQNGEIEGKSQVA